MANLDTEIQAIANEIIKEKWSFINNCFRKSLKFRQECRKLGVTDISVVMGIGIQKVRRLHIWFLGIHARPIIGNTFFEVTHTLEYRSVMGTNANDFKFLATIWI